LIGAGSKVPVNIWYVIDDAVRESESFQESQATFVAIGTIRVSNQPLWWLRLRATFTVD
jgi:hypothetical protein